MNKIGVEDSSSPRKRKKTNILFQTKNPISTKINFVILCTPYKKKENKNMRGKQWGNGKDEMKKAEQ